MARKLKFYEAQLDDQDLGARRIFGLNLRKVRTAAALYRRDRDGKAVLQGITVRELDFTRQGIMDWMNMNASFDNDG